MSQIFSNCHRCPTLVNCTGDLVNASLIAYLVLHLQWSLAGVQLARVSIGPEA